jgi:hypothetical protein
MTQRSDETSSGASPNAAAIQLCLRAERSLKNALAALQRHDQGVRRRSPSEWLTETQGWLSELQAHLAQEEAA